MSRYWSVNSLQMKPAARFRKIFSRGCHIALCRADDADRRRCSRAREWAVEQAFARYMKRFEFY